MALTPSTTSLLDSIKVIELLKNLILDLVRAVYGRSYPTSHYTFSVTTSLFYSSDIRPSSILYFAQAIVYTAPDSFAEWKLLVESVGADWAHQAMQNLYFKLQEKAGEITSGIEEGMIWNGAEAQEPDPQDARANR